MIYKANSFSTFLLVLLMFWPFISQSQHIYVVEEPIEGKLLFSTIDSVLIENFLSTYIKENQSSGFFNLSYSIETKEDTLVYRIIKGPQIQWSALKKGNLPSVYLGNYSFEQKFITGNAFSRKQIIKLFSAVITKAENSGYPFAYIHLDSLQINEQDIRAVINFNPGPYITFDSLKLSGSGKVNKKWLEAYLDIKQGEPFSQKKVDRIEEKIGDLTFLRLNNKSTLTFQNDEAIVYLDLKHQLSNQFDAVIGFAPGIDSDLLITGKANVELYNLFNRGHQLLFDWRRIKRQTQELELIYAIPNLLNTPFSIAGKADLFRQDTSFFNRNLQLDLSYAIGRISVGAFTRAFKSIKIGEEQNQDIKDISVTYFGVNGIYTALNKRFRPTNGVRIVTSIAAGNKEVNIDGIENSSTQLDIFFEAHRYQSVSSGFLYNGIQASGLFNKNIIFNDLQRIGGVNSIRGFPESYFYISQYYMIQNEYHWLFNDGSSFFILADAAYLKDQNYKYAYSFGLGFDLRVNNGIFELIYALGKEQNIPLSFDRSVLHFGYRAIF